MKLPKNGISKTVVDRIVGYDKYGVSAAAVIATAKKVHSDATEKQIRKALDNCIQRGYLTRTQKGRYKPRNRASSAVITPIDANPTQILRVTTETPEKAKINNKPILGACVFASLVVSAFVTLLLGN